MAQRITEKDLQTVCDRLNRLTGHALAPYTKVAGKHIPNAGTYLLSMAYGGYCLHQMADEGTGERDVLRCGHIPKRELYNQMHAFIDGIETAKD
jgi:hypothetical protein